MNRRSLTQAINVEAPDVREFLKAGLPSPKASPPDPAPKAEKAPPDSAPVLAPATAKPLPVSEAAPAPAKSKPNDEPDREESSIPVTFRLPESLVRAMISASAERKIRRIKPSTQQDIAALAIKEWLSRNDYL